MIRFILAAVLTVAMAGVAAAEHHFTNITAVDADKSIVVYKVTFGKDKNDIAQQPGPPLDIVPRRTEMRPWSAAARCSARPTAATCSGVVVILRRNIRTENSL